MNNTTEQIFFDTTDFLGAMFFLGVFWKLFFVLALLTGFCGNVFIVVNVFGDSQMRNTNYFFVLNLVLVDLFVIIGVLIVKEVAFAIQSENFLLVCFPTVWNFVVNYTASNFILLFLCYEKFVLIRLPFMKQKLLSMRVKAVFTVSVYVMTVMVGVLKFQSMKGGSSLLGHPEGGDTEAADAETTDSSKWCPFAFPFIQEWISDLIDMLFFFAMPLIFQLIMYTYIFFRAQEVSGVGQRSNQNNGVTLVSGSAAPRRQRPQLRVAKTCLVATVVRFSLWSPYVVHLVRLSLKQAFGLSLPGERSEYELIADKLFPDLTIIASCTNPIVFIAMSPPLQRRLKSFFVLVRNYCCCGIVIKKLCCPLSEQNQMQKNDVIDASRVTNGLHNRESTDDETRNETKKGSQEKPKLRNIGGHLQVKKMSATQTQLTETLETGIGRENDYKNNNNKINLSVEIVESSA